MVYDVAPAIPMHEFMNIRDSEYLQPITITPAIANVPIPDVHFHESSSVMQI